MTEPCVRRDGWVRTASARTNDISHSRADACTANSTRTHARMYTAHANTHLRGGETRDTMTRLHTPNREGRTPLIPPRQSRLAVVTRTARPWGPTSRRSQRRPREPRKGLGGAAHASAARRCGLGIWWSILMAEHNHHHDARGCWCAMGPGVGPVLGPLGPGLGPRKPSLGPRTGPDFFNFWPRTWPRWAH